MTRRAGCGVVGLLVAAMAAGVVAFWPGAVLPPVARWLDVSEPPRACDYVLPLGGGYEGRPFGAAAYYRAGLAPRVLLTEVWLDPATVGDRKQGHELARAILLARGVKPEDIQLLPGTCFSTFDEAQRVRAFLEQHPQATVNVLTTSYHTRRTRWVFVRELGPAIARVHFTSVPTDEFSPDNWWHDDEGLTTYAKEYAKYAFYRLRYGRWEAATLAMLAATLILYGLARRRSATAAA